MRNNKEAKLNDFISKKAQIDELLANLQGLSDDNFDKNPEEITWGDLGNLAFLLERLQEASDFIFQEGEHAE